MLCNECDAFDCDSKTLMLEHYKRYHPDSSIPKEVKELSK